MTLTSRIKVAVLALFGAALVTVGPAWIGYQVARGDAAYVLHVDDSIALPAAPDSHVVSVASASGDTYTIHDATGAEVDGRPVLLAQAQNAHLEFRDGGARALVTLTADGRTLVAQADTGSAAAPADAPTAEVPPIADPLTELAALKAKYEALKAAKQSGDKDLIWFAYALLGAGVLRVLLAALTAWRGDKPKGWAKWVALGAAVPLALLTYYGAGAGLWAAIVMAGAGPGAIVANELIKHFGKKTATA